MRPALGDLTVIASEAKQSGGHSRRLWIASLRSQRRQVATRGASRWLAAAFAFLAFGACLWVSSARAEELVPEPDGFKQGDYRSLVPETVQGARAIDTREAKAVFDAGGAIFVDVLPQSPRPPNLPAETIFREKPRNDIPGSTWLPDTGYGELAPVTEAWFRQNMARLTGDDKTKPVVIYCLADCWMSYNAAKRLASWGYSTILWYRDGTTAWEKAGYPVEDRKPVPRPQ